MNRPKVRSAKIKCEVRAPVLGGGGALYISTTTAPTAHDRSKCRQFLHQRANRQVNQTRPFFLHEPYHHAIRHTPATTGSWRLASVAGSYAHVKAKT